MQCVACVFAHGFSSVLFAKRRGETFLPPYFFRILTEWKTHREEWARLLDEHRKTDKMCTVNTTMIQIASFSSVYRYHSEQLDTFRKPVCLRFLLPVSMSQQYFHFHFPFSREEYVSMFVRRMFCNDRERAKNTMEHCNWEHSRAEPSQRHKKMIKVEIQENSAQCSTYLD